MRTLRLLFVPMGTKEIPKKKHQTKINRNHLKVKEITLIPLIYVSKTVRIKEKFFSGRKRAVGKRAHSFHTFTTIRALYVSGSNIIFYLQKYIYKPIALMTIQRFR